MSEYTSEFTFDFTLEKLHVIMPNNPQVAAWHVALLENLPLYEINTIERVAAFLAQTCHESANYTRLRENLNYKAASLIKTWPTRFNATNAPLYAHNQEKIANKVYANRMGNGDEVSGDGWKYKGRGILQITGCDNYTTCSEALYGDDTLLENPEMLENDFDASVKAACWFWDQANLNALADTHDILKMTKKINGGTLGLSERKSHFAEFMAILGE